MQKVYRRCDGLIVLYDITDISSFHGVSSWLGEVGCYFTTTPQIIIVGTKLDMATTNRQVEFSQAKQFADEKGLQLWETSSKDGTNVEEAIMSLITSIKRIKDSDEEPTSTTQQSLLVKLSHWCGL
ncbi:Ras family [Pelomyxa schiedti]|nr:Ras family [Pelomyxa schiedti]